MNKRVLYKLAGVVALALLLGGLVGVNQAFAQGGTDGTSTIEQLDGVDSMPHVGQKIPWADFQGAPTIPANTVGLWVWNENVNGQNVLRLRAGSDGTNHTLTGTVRTGRVSNFYDVAVVNGTGDDTTTPLRYNAFSFSIASTGSGEGVDANWSGTWLYLDIYVDGVRNPAGVFYGAAGTASTGAPLGVRAGKDGLLSLPLTLLDGPTPFVKNIATGFYLYRTNGKVFHMRLTTPSINDATRYRGTIIPEDGQFSLVHIYKGDARDYVEILADQRIRFQFWTKGYEDGLDWGVSGGGGSDNMIFTLKIDRHMAAPAIALGDNPFGTVKAYTFRLTD